MLRDEWAALGGMGSPGAEQLWTEHEQRALLGIGTHSQWTFATMRRSAHKDRFELLLPNNGPSVVATVPNTWLQRVSLGRGKGKKTRRGLWQFEAAESGTALGGVACDGKKQRIVWASSCDGSGVPLLLAETWTRTSGFFPAVTTARIPAACASRPVLLPIAETKISPLDTVDLGGVKPVWSTQRSVYSLPFFGHRPALTSIKNFQLAETHPRAPREIVLQFGRLDDDTFLLDFARPLCALQAFGIALGRLSCL